MTLANGTVWVKDAWQRTNILVEDGDIVSLSPDKTVGIVFDMTGLHIMPGGIDPHVHFREPGYTHKEDIFTGAYAASHGGVTCAFDMPNTKPATIDLKTLREKQKIAESAPIHVKFFMGASADNLDVIEALKDLPEEEQPVGVKVYYGSTTGDLLFDDVALVKKLFQIYEGVCVIHAESEARIQKNTKKFKEDDISVHGKIRDPECAAKAVEEIIGAIPKNYKGKVHIAHVSTKMEIDMIRKAKSAGIPITCEVTPHHLFFSEADLKTLGNLGKVNPPLRSTTDVEALWEGIHDGTVDCLATDHAPHLLEEKYETYKKAPAGMPGVETALPLMCLAERQGRITFEEIHRLRFSGARDIFNIPEILPIQVEAACDLTVLDMNREWLIEDGDMLSKSKWSPFTGMTVPCTVVMTMIDGTIIYSDDNFELPLQT